MPPSASGANCIGTYDTEPSGLVIGACGRAAVTCAYLMDTAERNEAEWERKDGVGMEGNGGEGNG